MEALVNSLNAIIWSPALIFLCLGAGLYFSIRTRFLQVRGFGEMIRLIFRGQSSQAGVSSFQALAMSLSGRVGTGNIAGVATAIAFGGPGAVFWMWVVAFLGASTAYVESTLAQIYKEKDDNGQYRGGQKTFIVEAGQIDHQVGKIIQGIAGLQVQDVGIKLPVDLDEMVPAR